MFRLPAHVSNALDVFSARVRSCCAAIRGREDSSEPDQASQLPTTRGAPSARVRSCHRRVMKLPCGQVVTTGVDPDRRWSGDGLGSFVSPSDRGAAAIGAFRTGIRRSDSDALRPWLGFVRAMGRRCTSHATGFLRPASLRVGRGRTGGSGSFVQFVGLPAGVDRRRGVLGFVRAIDEDAGMAGLRRAGAPAYIKMGSWSYPALVRGADGRGSGRRGRGGGGTA